MIDSSGSMYGEKLSHAVQAIKNIINALPESDNFNIIRFGNKVRTWRQYMAKSEDKVKAKVCFFQWGKFSLDFYDVNKNEIIF